MPTSTLKESASVAEPTPTPRFESPIVSTYPDGSGAALTLADASATTKTIVRADPDSAAAAGLGIGFGASRRHGDALVLGQRPGEWLLLGSAAANAAVVASIEVSGLVSIVDHTHSRALFRLTGATATSALEKVCNLDWSQAMTPDGAVVSATVAKVGCDIARDDVGEVPSYLIACDRSFGQYLFDAVLDAGHELGIGVVTGTG
jgi:heterotetrameric sarcosine oxidase gamma subunit